MSSHARSPSANEIHAEPHSDWISEEYWNNQIKEDPRVRPRLSSVVSIFRVPKFLKDTKIEAYVPQRVSLGPYHHRSAQLRPMGHHKGRAMRRMIKRFNTNMDFADRAKVEILKLEKEIMDSYEENIDCDGETLARMLSLDGCFILEVLRALVTDEAVESNEPIFGRKKIKYASHEPIFAGNKLQYAAYDILNDILMLENQVPLIVLRKLLELDINSAVDVQNQLPVKHILRVFNPFGFQAERFDIKQWYVEQQVHHLLGFLYTVIVSPPFNEGERVDQGDTAIVCPPFNRGECVDQDGCSIFIKCCCMCIGMLQDKNKARDDIESIPRPVELRIVSPPFNEGERVDQGDTAIVSPPFNEGERVDQSDTAIVSPPSNPGERVDQGESRIKCCMCTGMLPRDDIKSIPRIPRAVELRNSGIKFERCEGGIKEIKFDQKSATLYLPPISIQDSTEIVFRNLIAFEMCKSFEINYVACYVRLMDELIDSQEDVALLRSMDVLTNHLGSDKEVADIFNGLCKEVTASMEVFYELRQEVNSVNSHYKSKIKVQIAELVRDHCSSPWKALALTAAIFILLLTVVQTIFSIISVYKGK